MNDHSLFFVRKFKLIKALTSMSVWIFMPKLTIALRKNIQNIWILTLELVKNADFLTARKREALAVLQVAVIVGVVVVRTFVLIELYDAILLWICKFEILSLLSQPEYINSVLFRIGLYLMSKGCDFWYSKSIWTI